MGMFEKIRLTVVLLFIFVAPMFCFGAIFTVYKDDSFGKAKVALITDIGDIDDGGFNQSSWEGICDFCSRKKISCKFYKPSNDTLDSILEQIDIAVKNNAEIIVCPGFQFSLPVSIAQKKYKNVKFVLLDSETKDDVCSNTVCVKYKMEFSGFLAGYAVIQDFLMKDFKEKKILEEKYKLGFIGGMANAGVYPFEFGYIQGIIRGAKDFVDENQIKELPFIEIFTNFSGFFNINPASTALVKEWLMKDNALVVFSCGGKLCYSVFEAIKFYCEHNKINLKEPNKKIPKWIGVDSDQSQSTKIDDFFRKNCLTSAIKNIPITLETILGSYFDGTFDDIGGPFSKTQKAWVVGINDSLGRSEKTCNDKKDYVGIPIRTDKNGVIENFEFFNIDNFKKEKDKIEKNEIKVYDGTKRYGDEYNGDNDKNRGKATFMNNNEKFSNEYLGGYDIKKYRIVIYE